MLIKTVKNGSIFEARGVCVCVGGGGGGGRVCLWGGCGGGGNGVAVGRAGNFLYMA